MPNAVLQMNNSYSKLDRIDIQNYHVYESYDIAGSYNNEKIVLSYTLVASRVIMNSYPFQLEASIAPASASRRYPTHAARTGEIQDESVNPQED